MKKILILCFVLLLMGCGAEPESVKEFNEFRNGLLAMEQLVKGVMDDIGNQNGLRIYDSISDAVGSEAGRRRGQYDTQLGKAREREEMAAFMHVKLSEGEAKEFWDLYYKSETPVTSWKTAARLVERACEQWTDKHR